MDENNEAEKSYSKKSYFTPKNIIIYIIVAAVLYGAVYFLFLNKGNSPYNSTSNSATNQTYQP